MKTLLVLVLIVGAIVGAYFFLGRNGESSQFRQAEEKAAERAQDLTQAVKDKLKDINTSEIKEELEKTGQVVRKKAEQVGAVIADATSDARITATIKAKLVKHQTLSALKISVNTTEGVVTLSGSVDSAEDVSQAMKLALETEGVREAISTLQVKVKK